MKENDIKNSLIQYLIETDIENIEDIKIIKKCIKYFSQKLENKNISDYYSEMNMEKNNLLKDYIYSYTDYNINDDILNNTTTQSIIDEYKYYKVEISDNLYKILNIYTINQGLILNKNNIKIGDVHILKYESLTKELIFKTKINIAKLYYKNENYDFYSGYIVFSNNPIEISTKVNIYDRLSDIHKYTGLKLTFDDETKIINDFIREKSSILFSNKEELHIKNVYENSDMELLFDNDSIKNIIESLSYYKFIIKKSPLLDELFDISNKELYTFVSDNLFLYKKDNYPDLFHFLGVGYEKNINTNSFKILKHFGIENENLDVEINFI